MRLKKSDILGLIGSASVRAEVLFFFIENPEKQTYCRELEQKLGRGRKQVHQELGQLAKIGLLHSEKRGVERWFTLNKNHELAKALL